MLVFWVLLGLRFSTYSSLLTSTVHSYHPTNAQPPRECRVDHGSSRQGSAEFTQFFTTHYILAHPPSFLSLSISSTCLLQRVYVHANVVVVYSYIEHTSTKITCLEFGSSRPNIPERTLSLSAKFCLLSFSRISKLRKCSRRTLSVYVCRRCAWS